MKELEKKLVGLIVALSCTLIYLSNIEAATLTIGSEAGSPGDKNISIPINLTSAPGEEVSAFNFDLLFDASRLSFKEVTLGSVAVGAGKSLSHSKPGSNTIRLVVIGLNQNVISDGTVLTCTFDIIDNAPSGKAKLTIANQSISDPKGNQMPMTVKGGKVIVDENI